MGTMSSRWRPSLREFAVSLSIREHLADVLGTTRVGSARCRQLHIRKQVLARISKRQNELSRSLSGYSVQIRPLLQMPSNWQNSSKLQIQRSRLFASSLIPPKQ